MRDHMMTRFAIGFVTVASFWAALATSPAEGQPREDPYSFSIKEARRKGTFITKVRMTPSSIKWRKWEITVGEAWLEKSNEGGCYLCFRIEKGKEAFLDSNGGCCFVLGDARASVVTRTAIGLKWMQAIQYLESPDLSKVRLSLIHSWKDKRLKNIGFVATK